MNLNERGITVGDLFILVIIVLTTTTLIKTINKDNKTTDIQNNQEITSYKNNIYQKIS